MKKSILILLLCFSSAASLNAQFYLGPHFGFKSSGLEGPSKTSINNRITVGSIVDAGSTNFTAGLTLGFQVIPPSAGSLYKLDINIDASWANFSYLENGWNNLFGEGAFTRNGESGGSTNVISLDLMPIHRFNFSNFILSPYLGAGFGLNIMLTSDYTDPTRGATTTGNSEIKMGLLIFYGTLFNASRLIKPFIQFKHFIPFGDETKFTETLSTGQGTVNNFVMSVMDDPGYFSITAGIRFNF